jgi:hypothetical protein
MKWLAMATLPIALTLLVAPGNTALADDEEYVKVEIKGTLQLPVGPRPLAIAVKGKLFPLQLEEVVGGPPTMKQLEGWDGKMMVVQGRIDVGRVQPDGPPRVIVTRITPHTKPGPNKN